MEKDVIIMNKILRTAYELRSSVWITAHMIRRHIQESLSINEIKYYLAILCDRDMLKSSQEVYAHFTRKTIPGQKKAEKIPHKSDLYRITERGIKYVQAGCQKESKPLVFTKVSAKG
jgi:hypothetical protein